MQLQRARACLQRDGEVALLRPVQQLARRVRPLLLARRVLVQPQAGLCACRACRRTTPFTGASCNNDAFMSCVRTTIPAKSSKSASLPYKQKLCTSSLHKRTSDCSVAHLRRPRQSRARGAHDGAAPAAQAPRRGPLRCTPHRRCRAARDTVQRDPAAGAGRQASQPAVRTAHCGATAQTATACTIMTRTCLRTATAEASDVPPTSLLSTRAACHNW